MLKIFFLSVVLFSVSEAANKRAARDGERYTVVFRQEHSCGQAAGITVRHGFYIDCAGVKERRGSVYSALRFGVERDRKALANLRRESQVLAVSLAKAFQRQGY